jgi:HEAT repeat protein
LTAVTARAPRTQPEAVALVHACQQATADDLTLLAELARRDDPLTAGNAIAALGRLGRAADPGLLPLLRDPRPRVRHEMITAIGRSRALHAVPHLEPLLTDPDPVTQQLTIVALADLGAEEPLRRFVQNPAADPIARLFAEAVMAPHSRPALLSSTGSDN